jgi:cytochrome c oxidase subunit 1
MTATATDLDVTAAPVSTTAPTSAKPSSYLTDGTTVRSWLLTTDHKRIALLYFVSVSFFLFLGGILALALRLEHLTPGPTIMSAYTYNRVFTLHGVIMVFLFLIPSIPATFGNFLLPIMIGAKDLAFPRINLLSWYVYVAGAALLIWAMINGGLDTGWTFYTPYSSHSPSAVVPAVLGVFVVGWSSILTGLNFIVSVHTLRARGLQMMKMPLFVWAIYSTSIIQVLATPVLGLSMVLVAIDAGLGWGIFDPSRGGDPVLFQHLFWFYSHPAVYIMILPAMGVVSEVIPTFARKVPYSYEAIVYSALGIAFTGFLTWGHHMFTAGISTVDAGAFGILSMMIAVFSAIKVFTWVATLYRGSISLTTPLAYVFVFLFLFVFGGMTGVAVASTSLDLHWHDTYFVVAHFHFIMVGGALTGFLAGLHYWFPKVTGRMYDERLGLLACVLVFAGFFVTFFPQFLLGNAGMPRRYYYYSPEHQPLHVISTIGALGLGAALLLVVGYLGWALLYGERAPDNPWGSRSYEWLTRSPPPTQNFDEAPRFALGPYDYTRPDEEAHAHAAVPAPASGGADHV